MEKLIALIKLNRLWIDNDRSPLPEIEVNYLEMFVDLWSRLISNGFEHSEVLEIIESDIRYIGLLRSLDSYEPELVKRVLFQVCQEWLEQKREVSYPW